MAVPLQLQLFDAFLGTQEGIHSVLLPDVFSSGGSRNLWIDKYGRAKRILGYAKQNSSAVTTDTGGSATMLRALFPYRKTSGGSVTRQLVGVFDDAVNEYEVWTSTDDGATWTFRGDLGAGCVGQVPCFTQFGDLLLISCGKTTVRVWDGSSLAVAGSTQLAAPTATVQSSAGLLLGTYRYRVVPIKTDGTRKLASITSNAETSQYKQISLAWTADSDATVTGYEIYRTSGTGLVYYFTTYIEGRTTVAWTDNIEDLTILENRVLEEHGDAPPEAYYSMAHKQRVWYLRTDADPQAGWYSDPGDPDSVWKDANIIRFTDAETMGDVIVGGLGNFEGTGVIFQERSIWTISGTGQVIGNIVDWTRTRTNAQTGSVSIRSVVRVPAGAKYFDAKGQEVTTNVVTLAFFTPLGDIRLFDGDNDVQISHPVKTTLASFNYSARNKIHAFHDTARTEISWFIPTSGGECSIAVVWNYRWGVWYARDWPFACAAEMDSATTAALILAGEAQTSKGGFCYRLWTGNSFDGSAFAAQWMTKTLLGANDQGQPAANLTKRWRFGDFLFETEQNVTLTVEWMPGNSPDNVAGIGSTTISPSAAGMITSNGDRILTLTGDHPVVASSSSMCRAEFKQSNGRFLHDEGMRIRIGDNAALGSWSLESFTLGYQLLPGIKRLNL